MGNTIIYRLYIDHSHHSVQQVLSLFTPHLNTCIVMRSSTIIVYSTPEHVYCNEVIIK